MSFKLLYFQSAYHTSEKPYLTFRGIHTDLPLLVRRTNYDNHRHYKKLDLSMREALTVEFPSPSGSLLVDQIQICLSKKIIEAFSELHCTRGLLRQYFQA